MTQATDNTIALQDARTEFNDHAKEAERRAGFYGRIVQEVVYSNGKVIGVETYLKRQRRY